MSYFFDSLGNLNIVVDSMPLVVLLGDFDTADKHGFLEVCQELWTTSFVEKNKSEIPLQVD